MTPEQILYLPVEPPRAKRFFSLAATALELNMTCDKLAQLIELGEGPPYTIGAKGRILIDEGDASDWWRLNKR